MIYFVAFSLPALIWLLCAAVSGIFPFGTDIIFTSDMGYQYAGYFEHIQKILTEGISPFFSFYKGMGEETLGMISYYMMSPFNLILALFPKENVTEAVMLINLLKIGACGLTFSVFIKNKFKKFDNNPFAIAAFSVCYALMAYNIAYQFNIMWLDGVIWLPLIILGIDRLISKNKSELFYVSLTVALISNWYIGFMLCVFSGFYIFYELFATDDYMLNRRALKKFVLFGVLAAGTALIVIFPAALTCFSELSRDGLDDKGVISYTLFDIFSKFVIGGFDFEQITDKNFSAGYLNLPNLFCGTAVLFLFVLYFFNAGVDKKSKLRDGIFGIVLLIMTIFMPLNKIWHAFTYNIWFPYRYSFCLTFYMIYVSYKSLLVFNKADMKSVWKIFFVMVGIYFAVEKFNYGYLISELIYCTICMMFAAIIALKLIKKNEKKVFVFLCIVMCTECFLNTVVYMQKFDYWDRNEFYSGRKEVAEKLSEIPEEDKQYRVVEKITEDYNGSMGFEHLGIISSSTMGNESSRGLAEALGYTRVVSNSIVYSPTTRFADNFMGIKYYFSPETKKNDDALPLGFTVNKEVSEIKDFLTDWGYGIRSNSFENQNKLVKKAVGITENLYNPLEIFDIETENLEENSADKKDEEKNIKKYKKIYSGSKALYSFNFRAVDESSVYLKVNGSTTDRTKLYVNGKELCEYMMQSNYSAVKLGNFEKDEIVKVELEFIAPDDVVIRDIWVYCEDSSVYETVMSELRRGLLEVEEITGSRLTGKVDVKKSDALLMFTIPYDKYLKVYIDDKPAKTISVLDSLIAVPAEPGEHSVKVVYEPNYLIPVSIVSGLCIIAAIAIILAEYVKKEKTASTEKTEE